MADRTNTEVKTQHIDNLIDNRLAKTLQAVIVDLVEEGYSEVEIKYYIGTKVKNSLDFLEEYVAL